MQTFSNEVIKEIAKEELPGIKFTQEDALKDPAKIRLRNIYLSRAEQLGNAYKGKVKMVLIGITGEFYKVETTIWAANEDFVSLKGGVSIPTKAIAEIEF